MTLSTRITVPRSSAIREVIKVRGEYGVADVLGRGRMASVGRG